MFGNTTPKVTASPPPPESTGVVEENAANAVRLRMLRARGRQSTMLTGGLGLGSPNLGRPGLVGG